MDITDNNFEETGNIKYAMFVCQEKANESDEIHVVIGQNPSHSSSKSIDTTNQKIFQALMNGQEKANRYLLFNTFPIIDAHGSNSMNYLHVDDNIKLFERIVKELLKNKDLKIKIIFACGSSLPVYYPFIEKVFEIVSANKDRTETFAFEYKGSSEDKCQSHLSMQACNRLKRTDNSKFYLEKYTVDKKVKSDFAEIQFNKSNE